MIISFLQSIGIPVVEIRLEKTSFLPGIAIEYGSLIVDRAKLRYPGDLLHEAGHIALMTPEERLLASDNLVDHIPAHVLDGYELSAIAWSYAAAAHLNMPVELLFHQDGYKNDSTMLIQNYSSGNYLFTPLLKYYGLCQLSGADEALKCYPTMDKWLRD